MQAQTLRHRKATLLLVAAIVLSVAGIHGVGKTYTVRNLISSCLATVHDQRMPAGPMTVSKECWIHYTAPHLIMNGNAIAQGTNARGLVPSLPLVTVKVTLKRSNGAVLLSCSKTGAGSVICNKAKTFPGPIGGVLTCLVEAEATAAALKANVSCNSVRL